MNKIKKLIFVIIIILLSSAQSNAAIKDSLFATVGNKAITQSDIVNEIKIILILTKKTFSEENRSMLEMAAIKALITRNVKRIEIEKYENLNFLEEDLNNKIKEFANFLNVDLENFKKTFIKNKISFEIIVNSIKTDLLWNTLIFQLYKNRLNINVEEIEEQLKLISEGKTYYEYLLSEIIVKPIPKNELELGIEKIKSRIKKDGFESTAMVISIASTASKGGRLSNWLNEKNISENLSDILNKTQLGDVSKPIFLPQGIVFFKILDKRMSKEKLNLEEEKNKLVNSEKEKILNMFSLTHYDKLRRAIPINYY